MPRQAVRLNSLTEVALTKLDVLDTFDTARAAATRPPASSLATTKATTPCRSFAHARRARFPGVPVLPHHPLAWPGATEPPSSHGATPTERGRRNSRILGPAFLGALHWCVIRGEMSERRDACPQPWWSEPSGATRGRASSPTSSPRRCTWSSATRAATTPATRIVVDGETFALQLVPSGVLYDHITPVIGNGVVVDPAVLLAEVDRLAGQGRRLLPAGRVGQRPPDHAVPPGARPRDRALPRARTAGHDQARHRPGLRRQGGPGRPPGAGPARPEDLPPEARRGPEGEERRPGQDLQPAARSRPTTSPPATSTNTPPDGAR